MCSADSVTEAGKVLDSLLEKSFGGYETLEETKRAMASSRVLVRNETGNAIVKACTRPDVSRCRPAALLSLDPERYFSDE